ncbi:MAG: sulfurtransferase TusA family protein [Pseudomonadota bacterium]
MPDLATRFGWDLITVIRKDEGVDAEEYGQVLDVRGYRCPMPVVKMEALLREVSPGARIKVIADDPIARVDIPHFCEQGGHGVNLIENCAQEYGQACVFLVTRGQKPRSD